MIVAGVGCRRGCPAEIITALVRRAETEAGVTARLLAAPSWKRDEPGVHGAAAALGLPLVFIDAAGLASAQARCVTHSQLALQRTGIGSVAEGAALAARGGTLLLPRIGSGEATCALAGPVA